MNRSSIAVTRSYLEVARAFFPLFLKRFRRAKKLTQSELDSMIFGFMSVTAVYSYSALEAFCNYHIYKLPNISIGHKKRIIKGKRTEEKLDYLCNKWGIPKIIDTDPQLWSEFIKLTKKIRNFFIHPKVWQFPSKVGQVFSGITIGKYSEVSTKIITHFYTNLGKSIPPWLRRNQIYQFNNIEFL